METRDVVVKRNELLPRAKGQYMRIHYLWEGKETFSNIFDEAKWHLCGANLAVRLHGEPSGKWWNVIDVEAISNVFEQEAAKKVAVQMSDGKNRSYALSYAKDWCIACKQAGEDVKTAHIISIATIFESYLDNEIEEH